MEEPTLLKTERKSRRKASSYFSTDSPETFIAPILRISTTETIERTVGLSNTIREEAESKEIEEEDDLTVSIEGMNIDNLALDGAMAMNVLNDVLHKIGIDVSGADPTAPVKHSKKHMSPWEIKCNIQTQIIIHLGRRMEKMQEVIDDLNSKIAIAMVQKQRIKLDRDETRSRLVQVTTELKEKTKLLEHKGMGIFDEQDLINTVLNELKNTSSILEQPPIATLDNSGFRKEGMVDSSKAYKADDDDPLEDLLAIHADTKDQLRKMIALMQVKKSCEPLSKLGVGLKSMITDDDIISLNPFRGNLRTPYKLDAFNYQPQEAQRLIRNAKNQFEYLKASFCSSQQQLLRAKDNDEKISILEEQSARNMDSLSICMDLLCEEQVYAWKWRSRCRQLGRKLEDIKNLFSRFNIEANRMVRKEQRMVGSILQKEYIKSGKLGKMPIQSTHNCELVPLVRPNTNSITQSNFRINSPRSDKLSSDRPHSSLTPHIAEKSSNLSMISFPDLE